MTDLNASDILRAEKVRKAPDNAFRFAADGGIYWQEERLAQLQRGARPLEPAFQLTLRPAAPKSVHEALSARLDAFIRHHISEQFAPLYAIGADETLNGGLQEIGAHLQEELGIIARAPFKARLTELAQEERAKLRGHGVRFGQFYIFIPAFLKPEPTAVRLALAALWFGDAMPDTTVWNAGLVTQPRTAFHGERIARLAGFHIAGARAIRIDILERLIDLTRAADEGQGFVPNSTMLNLCGLSSAQFGELLEALGYRADKAPEGETKDEEIVRFHWQGARNKPRSKPLSKPKKPPRKPSKSPKSPPPAKRAPATSNPFADALKDFAKE